MRPPTIAKTLAALLAGGALTVTLASGSEAPVRVTGLASVYCTNTETLKATIENTSNVPLSASVSVDKLLVSGEWEEYVADILAEEPFPWKVTALQLSKGQSRAIEWGPPHTAARREPLSDGTYRLVVYVTGSHRTQGQRHVAAQFSVANEACGRSPSLQPSPASRPSEKTVRVEVESSSNHRSIKGARVFVLSEAGKELASSFTDEHGIARLPVLGESERPKYVVVEHPAFFLGGMRWQPGLMEYYVLVTVLAVR
jgi:hypothetical protein